MALFALLNRGQDVVCATLDLDGLRNYQYVAFGQHFVFRNVKTFELSPTKSLD